MSLVHIIRIEVKKGHLGRTIYRLIDKEGDFILGFDRYSRFLIDKRHYPFSTLKRYSEAASRFIDYLYEVRVLGEPTTNLEINRAVEAYPHLLRAGARFKDGDIQRTKQLRAYATAIGMKEGLSRNSFPPTLAAINLLLLVAQDLAHEAAATVGPLNVTESTNAEVLISAINGFTSLSYHETKRLKQNSLLGSVMHLRGPLRRPNSLRSPIKQSRQTILERFDFPLTKFADLVNAATCYRDKALWCLLAAGGLREHEALNLRVSHIDLST